MRRSILLIAALCIGLSQAKAQEYMIDNIAKGTLPHIGSGGDMGQFIYTYHTSSDDTLHFTLLDPRLNAMSTINLSTKGLGSVVTSSFNGQSVVILFYNADKKTATLYATDQEGRESTKKIIKGINSVNDKAYILPSINPEKTIFLHETSNGYSLTVYNNKLEELVSKTGDKKIVQVRMNMDIISIIAKNKTNSGIVSFSLVNIQSEEGVIVNEIELKDGNDVFYPNFFTSSEGMTYSGGMYFTDGLYSNKSPEGIYFTMLTPDGSLESIMKTPYSAVIQDIKNGYDSKLLSGEYKIMLHNGARKTNGSGFVVTGEIYSVKRTANGDAIFKVHDLVSIHFDNEFKYKGTYLTKKSSKEATVKGSILKGNDIDVAMWMKEQQFFDLKLYVETGMAPNMIYTEIDANQTTIAAKVPGDTTNSLPVNFVIDKLAAGGIAPGTTVFNSDVASLYPYGVIQTPEQQSVIIYQYIAPRFVVWINPVPKNENNPLGDGMDNNHPGDEPQPDDNVVE